MKLVELYVAEVGRRLPEKQRQDIQNELRSSIEDALDDEARARGKAPDEALAAEVLRRFGPPWKTAASYLPTRYLIGPELYPRYVKVLGTVLGVLVLVSAIAFGVQLGVSADVRADFAGFLARSLGQLVSTLFEGAAFVTLVFAIFELTAQRAIGEPQTWDPLKLKAEPDPERFNALELTFELVFSVAALAVFNLYPQWVAVYWLQNGQWFSVPVLSQAFFQYLPLFNLWWVLQIVMDVILLAQRRWQPLTRWYSIGLDALRVVIFFIIVLGPSILAIDPITAARLGLGGLTPQLLGEANTGLNTALRIGLGIAAAASAVDVGRDIYRRLLRGRLGLAAL